MSSPAERPRLILQSYPTGDLAFAREVRIAVDAVFAGRSGPLAPGEDLEAVIQHRLRASYPKATVHLQNPFARLHELEATLYAYRDGRIRAQDPRRDRVYDALARARTSAADSPETGDDSLSVTAHSWQETAERHDQAADDTDRAARRGDPPGELVGN